jgi:ABC-2 type transport system ATP-binding protein
VAALGSDVELLILDEPTAGLGPLMESIFAECIRELKGAGRTVLPSSHILAQVEALCDRVSIIRLGHVVESSSLSELRHLTRTTIDLDTSDGNVRFDVDAEHLDAAIGYLHSFGIRALVNQPPTLEQLFMRHYGDDLAGVTTSAGTSAASRRGGTPRRARGTTSLAGASSRRPLEQPRTRHSAVLGHNDWLAPHGMPTMHPSP